MDHIQVGSFYEINHSRLPVISPPDLHAVRAAMVTAKSKLNVTIRYPGTQSLQAFFSQPNGRLPYKSKLYPGLDQMFDLEPAIAVEVLGRQISHEFEENKHSESFWLTDCFKPQSLGLPAANHNAKNGGCFSILQQCGIKGWGSKHVVHYGPVPEHYAPVPKQLDDPEEALSTLSHGDGKQCLEEAESHEVKVKKELIQYTRKRKHGRSLTLPRKKGRYSSKHKLLALKPKIEGSEDEKRVDRWSAARYEIAVEKLVEVLKSSKAVYGHPITRAKLREEARRKIGDTGLLDHLLKHLAGRVVPSGGVERLRRRCDSEGKMEYWLESADLVNIRKEAGVKDPYWTPPPGWKPGDLINPHNCICCQEVRLLRDELSCLRRQVSELKCEDENRLAITAVLPESADASRRFHNDNTTNVQDSYELLVKKKSVMEEQLLELSRDIMELEGGMKGFLSKAEAIETPLMLSYSKSSSAEQPNERNRTSTGGVPEDSEESSESDDEDEELESQATQTFKFTLKPCSNPEFVSNKASHAVDHSREDLMAVTPASASPHSSTTS